MFVSRLLPTTSKPLSFNLIVNAESSRVTRFRKISVEDAFSWSETAKTLTKFLFVFVFEYVF